MDEVYMIRHRVHVQGVSVRQVAHEMKVSRNTVRRYLCVAEPGKRKAVERPRPVLDQVCGRMDELLEDSKNWTTRKQRLTAQQLHRMLLEEEFSVGYSTVKEYVREWKRKRQEVFIPLEYRPGDLAEVDFFEATVEADRERRKAFLFVMRLMYSGVDFIALYDRQDQVSFLDGHVRSFAHFGFIPRRILYDNLKAAVAKILLGSERKLARRFSNLAQHHLYEPCFARPYTGHDKGGVEARGKGIRLRYMVPVPRGNSLQAIEADVQSRIDASRDEEKFAQEAPDALQLPEREFDPAAPYSPLASKRSLVSVDGAFYSVPCEWAGLNVTARVGPFLVEIVGPDGQCAHPRQKRGGRSVDYRHFLREFARKPNAIRQVGALLAHDMGGVWTTVWERLVSAYGEKRTARLFAELLRGIETMGMSVMEERLRPILQKGEPPLLALVRSNEVALLDSSAIPEKLREIAVEQASVKVFDQLAGGAS